jgi:hypothetical protein
VSTRGQFSGDFAVRQAIGLQLLCQYHGVWHCFGVALATLTFAMFNDPAVSGADPIESRPGFAALLNRIEGNGVRVVLVEDAGRFARDLMAQELGLGASFM